MPADGGSRSTTSFHFHFPRRQLDHARVSIIFARPVDVGSWDKAELGRSFEELTRHPRALSVPDKILKLRPGLIWKVLFSRSRKILFSPLGHTVPSV